MKHEGDKTDVSALVAYAQSLEERVDTCDHVNKTLAAQLVDSMRRNSSMAIALNRVMEWLNDDTMLSSTDIKTIVAKAIKGEN